MTPIEILALIVVMLSVIKIIIILTNPKSWLSVVKAAYGNTILTSLASLILAAIVLNYLLKEITIVQIFATILFVMLIITIGFAPYNKEMLGLAEKLMKDKNFIKRSWLSIVIWLVLIVWVLYALFVQ